MNSRIHFDHSATTPLDPRVLGAMVPFLGESFGNPSSLHEEGRTARKAVEVARARVASLIGANAEEIIFTASGTEADNLALTGAVRTSGKPGHIVTSSIEHAAILETCRFLTRSGTKITHLRVKRRRLGRPIRVVARLAVERHNRVCDDCEQRRWYAAAD
jgi:cysteine desulfurase